MVGCSLLLPKIIPFGLTGNKDRCVNFDLAECPSFLALSYLIKGLRRQQPKMNLGASGFEFGEMKLPPPKAKPPALSSGHLPSVFDMDAPEV